MTPKRLLLIVVRAAVLGVVIASPVDDDALVPLEIWLGVTAALIAANLLVELVRVAAVEPASVSFAWEWDSPRRRRPVDKRPSGLRAAEALLTSAQTNHRAHTNRLQPRLIELANHFLPLHHAVDPAQDPVRAKTLLGEVAWLIDPEVKERAPTTGELNQFLAIIMSEPDHRLLEH